MVTIVLKGGVGNQFFQYAFGRRLEAEGNEVVFDRSGLDSDTTRTYILDRWNTRIRFGKPGGTRVNEPNLLYKPEFIKKYDEDVTLDGYWQCEKYFLPIESEIRSELTLREAPSHKTLEVLEKIQKNSVFIHVRRTDNVSVRGMAFHGLCGQEYFTETTKYVSERVENPQFFLFSDDIEWCKENIKIDFPTIFVDHNTPGVTSDSEYFLTKTDNGTEHEDLFLMSQCGHGIMATSTFSWWAAWLVQNSNKIVVTPKRWFVGDFNQWSADIIPESWVRV